MGALLLSGAVPALAAQQPAAPAAPPALVFDGVTVVDVEQGKLVPDQRVVITGPRIQAVGTVKEVKVPPDAQVVDARGKYLIPGLWDMHVNIPFSFAYAYPLFIANGVTGIRGAHSWVPLDSLAQLQQAILAGAQVGPPRQLHSGGVFGLTLGMGSDKNSAAVEHIIDSLKAHGAHFIEVQPFSQYLTVAAAARRAGIPFEGRVSDGSDRMTAIEASDSGMRIIEHAASLQTPGGLDTLCYGLLASVARCQPVAERLRRNNTWSVPSLVIYSGSNQTRGIVTPDSVVPAVYDAATFLRLGARSRSVFTPASEPIYRRLKEATDSFWLGPAVPGTWLREIPSAPVADSVRLMRIAQRVGLPVLAGTGTSAGGPGGDFHKLSYVPGFALHAELAMYVAEGLTPLAALQSATLNPAKMLRGTDSLGTVAPGKLADLVLLDADPLTNITNTTAIRAVVANGRYFDRAALDKLSAEAEAQAYEP